MKEEHAEKIVRAYFDLRMLIEMNGVTVYGDKEFHEEVVGIINQYPELAAYYLSSEERGGE